MNKIKLFVFSLLFVVHGIYAMIHGNPADSQNSKIFFDYGKYELKAETIPVLDSIISYMLSDTTLKLIISGHTDSSGTFDFNLQLSKNRAESVKNYLISKGCRSEKIETEAMSFTKPTTQNNSESNRSLNRRVEFTWLKDEIKILPEVQLNGTISANNGDTLNIELSIIDKDSSIYKELEQENITAELNWKQEQQEKNTRGKIHLIPLNDRKKIAVSLIMDYSLSMWDSVSTAKNTKKSEQILAMENAVKIFIDNCDNRTYAKIIKFAAEFDEITKFTTNKQFLKDAVETRSYPRSATALFSAIHRELKNNPYTKNPAVMKTIIAFTDGDDNSSGNITTETVIKLASETGNRVYTVGLFRRDLHSEVPGLKYKGEADLYSISKNTGGFYYYSPDAGSLENIYKSIFESIINSYSISILWEKENLPPKGTNVTAILKVKIKNETKTFVKEYIMD